MKISWGRAFAGALVAEAGQILASILWVVIYSYFIHPGQSEAAYQAHAEVSAPWVSIFAGAPIFYAASRWIARSRHTALALFGIFFAIDGALLVSMIESWTAMAALQMGLSYTSKFFACLLGSQRLQTVP